MCFCGTRSSAARATLQLGTFIVPDNSSALGLPANSMALQAVRDKNEQLIHWEFARSTTRNAKEVKRS